MTMIRGVLIWLVASAVGAGLVAIPDTAPRVFSFSEGHGPSWADLPGVLLVVLGWVAFVVPLWRSRRQVRAPWAYIGIGAVGLLLLGWSVAGDHGSWWVLGVGLLASAQLAAAGSLIAAARSES